MITHTTCHAPLCLRNVKLFSTCPGPASLQHASLRHLRFFGACLLCALVFVFAFAGLPRVAFAETEHKNTINVNQLADSSFLYDTSISSLATADSFQDAQIVQIRGEVVGDCINDESRSDACWITLAEQEVENPAVISVLMTNEQASAIDTFGNYSKRGTILQVRGTYYLNCSEHQGLSDVHTEEVSVIEQGAPIEHEVNPAILTAAFFSILMGLGLLFFYSWRRERMR